MWVYSKWLALGLYSLGFNNSVSGETRQAINIEYKH